MSPSFDAPVLFVSIHSDLSYSSIYTSYKRSSKNVEDNIYHLFQKYF